MLDAVGNETVREWFSIRKGSLGFFRSRKDTHSSNLLSRCADAQCDRGRNLIELFRRHDPKQIDETGQGD